MLVLRKRIKLVVQLFKEAGKAVHSMPLILLQPFWVSKLSKGNIKQQFQIWSKMCSNKNGKSFQTWSPVQILRLHTADIQLSPDSILVSYILDMELLWQFTLAHEN